MTDSWIDRWIESEMSEDALKLKSWHVLLIIALIQTAQLVILVVAHR